MTFRALRYRLLAVTFASMAACGSEVDTTDATTVGSGGATTSSGGASVSSSGGSGGSGVGGGGGDDCHGDQTAWDAIVKGDIACQDNSDCCVVANQCTAEAYMVASADLQGAQAAWPYCEPNECANCLPPVVEIACVNNVCTGYIDPNSFDGGSSVCGDDNVDPDPTGKQSGVRRFSCDGAS